MTQKEWDEIDRVSENAEWNTIRPELGIAALLFISLCKSQYLDEGKIQ